jgi:hypothetical protein
VSGGDILNALNFTFMGMLVRKGRWGPRRTSLPRPGRFRVARVLSIGGDLPQCHRKADLDITGWVCLARFVWPNNRAIRSMCLPVRDCSTSARR